MRSKITSSIEYKINFSLPDDLVDGYKRTDIVFLGYMDHEVILPNSYAVL